MKLWNKGYEISREIEAFTVGNDRNLDLLLAKFEVLGSIAHGMMLQKIGLLSKTDFKKIYSGLKKIFNQIENGSFKIDQNVEDVHSQIELILTESLGETGKRIHAGRSRNDQILLDIRLFVRDEFKEIVSKIKNLFDLLIKLSNTHKDKFLPGYTHLQVAMPSSFGLWFAAYAESFIDDLIFLLAAYQIINKNPLGSAAGYGSSLPLNRQFTSELLGFDSLNYNSVYAQMGRGKTEKVVGSVFSQIASTLSKLASDICLYMNQNFDFINFPKELTTGSSIMPHKNNPDVFELIRAKCNKLQMLPTEFAIITGNLPSGYHRDFQILKESFLTGFDTIKNCLHITCFMLKHIQINEKLEDRKIYQSITSVEAVNQLVLQGKSFRAAYQQIGKEIEEGTFTPPKGVSYTHEGSLGNLQNEKIVKAMNKVVHQLELKFKKTDIALNKLLTIEL